MRLLEVSNSEGGRKDTLFDAERLLVAEMESMSGNDLLKGRDGFGHCSLSVARPANEPMAANKHQDDSETSRE